MKKCFIQKIKDQIFANDFQDLIDYFSEFISNHSSFWKYSDKWPKNLIKHYNNFSTNQNLKYNILGKGINISYSSNPNALHDLSEDSFDFFRKVIVLKTDNFDNPLYNKCIGVVQDQTGPYFVWAFYSIDNNSHKKTINLWAFVPIKSFNQLAKLFKITLID